MSEKTLTAEEYLEIILARNPGLDKPDDEIVKLRARGLRNLIRQAHAKGVEHGRGIERRVADLNRCGKGFFG